eukprot:4997396-Prymnesium_polylepis.1
MGPAHPNMGPRDHVNMGRRMSTWRAHHVSVALRHVNIAAYVNVVKTNVNLISHVSIPRAVLSWVIRLCKGGSRITMRTTYTCHTRAPAYPLKAKTILNDPPPVPAPPRANRPPGSRPTPPRRAAGRTGSAPRAHR